jgi:formylglycine-generating enzyme required for sulfatase activity
MAQGRWGMSKDRRKDWKIEVPEATRLARVFSDHPLRDQRLEFEFEGFARTLAELAWNPDNTTPFTVVVRGGWGRGKTTLLRRAQWMLENPAQVEPPPPDGVREVHTLWFNAWKYPDDDTVLAGLLGAAIDRLRKGGKLDQLKHLVASYKSATLQALFGLAAPAPLRDLILGDGGKDRYAPVHEKRAFHDTFRDLFNQVSRLLFELQPAFRDTGGLPEEQLWNPDTQRRQVLAVFLDDLDRCREKRVAEVVEAINLFLDLPGVCFFLGTDWERLVAVLPETVQGHADQFLEKVVQVAFDLPEVSPHGTEGYVRGLLRGTDLEAVLASDGEGASEDVRVLAQALETRHPRHVKRFLNDLSVTLAVLRNTGKLGDGEEELSEPAVVAWHLLSEILPRDRWREVRALPQNLAKFLRETEKLEREEPTEGEAGEREAPAEWARIRASGLPERHLKVLRELTDRQRHLLVYFATPPAVEVPRERPTRGKRDLFDLTSGAWAEIPGGSFWMGAQKEKEGEPGYDPEADPEESPVRRVTVSPFRVARHPVTNAEYAVFVEETGKRSPMHWKGGRIPEGKDEHPVVHVSWTDAVAFCEWLSRRISKEDPHLVRLPTEAEWEYVARGEEGRKYPWGDAEPSDENANFGRNVGDTTPVGSYPDGATPEGVHDLAGNVWEWCGDWTGPYPREDEEDPTGPASGTWRVLRGGAFGPGPRYLRAATRYGYRLGRSTVLTGFRVCCGWSRGL